MHGSPASWLRILFLNKEVHDRWVRAKTHFVVVYLTVSANTTSGAIYAAGNIKHSNFEVSASITTRDKQLEERHV